MAQKSRVLQFNVIYTAIMNKVFVLELLFSSLNFLVCTRGFEINGPAVFS